MAAGRPRFTVRKQSSGRTFSETFYVYDTQRKGRVTVHPHRHREDAQREADRYNEIFSEEARAMAVTFPVISRHTGYVETVEVTRPLGTRTRDKVIEQAAKYGWALEHGYQNSLLQTDERGTGELLFRNVHGDRVCLEFGSKGQITYCDINGRRVDRDRYQAVVIALVRGSRDPDGGYDLAFRLHDPGMPTAELVRKVRTSGCVDYTTRDGKTFRLTPSTIVGSSAIWAKEVEV